MEPSGMCLSGLRWRERAQRGKEGGESIPSELLNVGMLALRISCVML
jgi:hypothetical protein